MSVLDDYEKLADYVDDSDRTEIPTWCEYTIKIGVKKPFDENEIKSLGLIFDKDVANYCVTIYDISFKNGIYSFRCRWSVDDHPLYLLEEYTTLPLEIADKILWISVEKEGFEPPIHVIYPNLMVIEWVRKWRPDKNEVELRLLFVSNNLFLISSKDCDIDHSKINLISQSAEFHKYVAGLFSFDFEYFDWGEDKGLIKRYPGLFGGKIITTNKTEEWDRRLQDAKEHSDDFTLWKIDKNKNAYKVENVDESMVHRDGDYFRIVRFEIKDLCSGRIRKIYLKFIWTPDWHMTHMPKDCNVYAFIV